MPSAEGEAKSKKAAKREAARHILMQLLERSAGPNYPVDNRNVSYAIEYRPTAEMAPKRFQQQQYQQTYDTNNTPNVACIDMLQELACRRNFRVIYLKLDTKTSTGLVQVMLQVSAWPVIVCRGQGRTVLAAKADAALNALECLRLNSARASRSQMIHFEP